MRKRTKCVVSLVISAALLVLTACAQNNYNDSETPQRKFEVKQDQTISFDSKWVNSSVEGALGTDSPVSLKDDFYSAVNKDWITQQVFEEDEDCINFATVADKEIKERKIAIISNETTGDEIYDDLGIDDEELAHDNELVYDYAQMIVNWEQRNVLGAEPVRPYIESIESINSLDEMSQFFLDFGGKNMWGYSLAGCAVENTIFDPSNNYVVVSPCRRLSLTNQDYYRKAGLMLILAKDNNQRLFESVMNKLGYESDEIRRIMRLGLRFEGRLADHMEKSSVTSSLDYGTDQYVKCKASDLSKHCGAYPLAEILKKLGYAKDDDEVVVYEIAYLDYLSKAYSEKYLEEMKDYLIINTVLDSMLFLDRESYNLKMLVNEDDLKPFELNSGEEDKREEEINDDWDIALNVYFANYFPGPLEISYVTRYCSKEQKQGILDMIEDIKKYFSSMVKEEKWLTKETQELIVEKLDAMSIRAIYPDTFDSYSSLDFDGCETILDMQSRINAYYLSSMSEDVGKPYDKDEWDFDELTTTTVNAYYMPLENSINIMAGIASDGFTYDPAAPVEMNMGRLGTIIGHEITHGFDTSGAYFDKNGIKKRWWKIDDMAAFSNRSTKLYNYYDSLTALPGGKPLLGANLSGEAIADMGGVKCMLGLAKEIPDFDYDLFFRSYAELWRQYSTYDYAENVAMNDPHPPVFLRTNAVLIQFDEFVQTYGIQEGDGMYVKPDDRIMVW